MLAMTNDFCVSPTLSNGAAVTAVALHGAPHPPPRLRLLLPHYLLSFSKQQQHSRPIRTMGELAGCVNLGPCLAAGFATAATGSRCGSAHAPHLVAGIVGYEQGAVGHGNYAHGATMRLVRVAAEQEAGQERLGLAAGLAILAGHKSHLVARVLRAVPGAVLAYEGAD